MSKNYSLVVAGILGVEPFEVFKINGYDAYYRFTPEVLQFSSDKVEWKQSSQLSNLIYGTRRVIKLPYRPELGQVFYTPSSHLNNACVCRWEENIVDIALYEAGLVFRTENDCVNALAELRKKYPSVVESLKKEGVKYE